MSEKGKPYGSEFRTLLKAGNIKFVKQNAALNAKDPLETMTKGRIYATINDEGKINAISYYGADGKRLKTINLLHSHEQFKGVHTHIGYYHDEGGTRALTADEKKLIAFVKKAWYNRHSK
nr:MAG TPA: hypothetical protein [Caudoviricetes sp.]